MKATPLAYLLAEKSHATRVKLGTTRTHAKCVLAIIATIAETRFHAQVATCSQHVKCAGAMVAAESADFNFTWMMTQKGSSASHAIQRRIGTSFLVYTHMHMYMTKYC